MRIYVAGPMRGIEAYNFPAFDEATETLRSMGHEVISPAEMDRHLDDFDPTKDKPQSMACYMKRDLPAVLSCSAVAVLPGWLASQGARLEVHAAIVCGIPIYEYQAGIGLTRKIEPHVNVSEAGECFRSPRTATPHESIQDWVRKFNEIQPVKKPVRWPVPPPVFCAFEVGGYRHD